MLVAQTLTSGCRCEANTNVPGAPRILDPPLFVVNFGTWTMNPNALWQLKSPDKRKLRKPKPLASRMAAVKKVGQKNGEVGLLVEYLFCALIASRLLAPSQKISSSFLYQRVFDFVFITYTRHIWRFQTAHASLTDFHVSINIKNILLETWVQSKWNREDIQQKITYSAGTTSLETFKRWHGKVPTVWILKYLKRTANTDSINRRQTTALKKKNFMQ